MKDLAPEEYQGHADQEDGQRSDDGPAEDLVDAGVHHLVQRLPRAKAQVSKELFSEAERELKGGIQQNQKSFKLRLALSEVYGKQGQMDKAVAILKECLTLDRNPAKPEIIDTKYALARIYLMQRDLDESTRYADEVLKENPKSLDAHSIKGRVYLLKGDGLNAVSELRKVVDENPQSMAGMVNLAQAHMLNREYDLAIDVLQGAVKIEPNSENPVGVCNISTDYASLKNTGARICPKGNAGIMSLYDPDRLKKPLKRVGGRGAGQWQEISYAQAVTEIAGKLGQLSANDGPEKLVWFTEHHTCVPIQEVFCNAYGTSNFLQHSNLCDVARKFGFEKTSDFVNWTSLHTGTAPCTFVDAHAAGLAARYYRAVPASVALRGF